MVKEFRTPLSIEFAADYEKLPIGWEGKLAKLIGVKRILIEEQNTWLLKYDTKFRGLDQGYCLPANGEYILLTFEASNGTIFLDLRKDNVENRSKYSFYRGRLFTMVFKATQPT